jgi:hypothetical protein
MGDFVPDDMLTIELNPKEEIVSNILLEFSRHIFTVRSRGCTSELYLHQRSLLCEYTT